MFQLRPLTPAVAGRMADLASSEYRPKEIRDLKHEIESETQILDLRLNSGIEVTRADINKIVQMKFQLDGLYGDWLEGKIS